MLERRIEEMPNSLNEDFWLARAGAAASVTMSGSILATRKAVLPGCAEIMRSSVRLCLLDRYVLASGLLGEQAPDLVAAGGAEDGGAAAGRFTQGG